MQPELKEIISQPHEVQHAVQLAEWLNNNPQDLQIILMLLNRKASPQVQLLAWGLGKIKPETAQHLSPQIASLIALAKDPTHPAVRRNILKILGYIPAKNISEELLGKLWEFCVEIMEHKNEPSSHHAYSMSIMENTMALYPELIHEFKEILKLHSETMTPAVSSRKNHIFKNLNSMNTALSKRHK